MRGIDAVLRELDGGIYDIQIGFDGDIETADSFDTFIIVALLTDARADESEVRDSSRRRGWAGNEHTPGFQMGSKIWIYEQARLKRSVMNDLEKAAMAALQSLVDEGYAVAIREISVRATESGLYLEISIERTPSRVEKRLYELWQNTGVS